MLNWKDIGILLKIPWQQLKVWEKERDIKDCCNSVLNHWLDHSPDEYPATWEGLYELLDDCEFGQLVTKLKIAVKNAVY